MNREITAIYVRVSTAKESQKDSPEHQKGLCEEKARSLNLDVRHVYEDRDSGTSIVGRQEIQRLILNAKEGCFGTVLFASLSRFSRDTLDSLNLKRILVDALGLRLISIEEGYDSFKDSDELKFQIISAVNQKLSEQISLSSKRGIRQSALKGNYTGSIPPFGYKKAVIGGRKTLVPDESNKQVVQLIYTLYTARKMGEKAIVNYLNTVSRIPAPKGGRWGLTSIQRILTNEVYIGKNVFAKYEVKKVYNDITNMSDRRKIQVQREKTKWERSKERTHEAIITDETFQAAQEIRLKRGGGQRGGVRNRVNLFAGMVFCKHCGGSMVTCKSRRYRYLICSTRRRQGAGGCENGSWLPYEAFRDTVIQAVSHQFEQLIDVHQTANRYKDRIIHGSRGGRDKERKKLHKLIEANRRLLFEIRKQNMLGELDEEQYRFEKLRYEKEIAGYREQFNQLNEKTSAQNELDLIGQEICRALNELVALRIEQADEMRLVLMKVIDKLVVSRCGEIEIYTPLGQPEA